MWRGCNYAIVYYMSQLVERTSDHTDHHPCSETKCIANDVDLKQNKELIPCGAAVVSLMSVLVEKTTEIITKRGIPLGTAESRGERRIEIQLEVATHQAPLQSVKKSSVIFLPWS